MVESVCFAGVERIIPANAGEEWPEGLDQRFLDGSSPQRQGA